jgi:hypothetical protein
MKAEGEAGVMARALRAIERLLFIFRSLPFPFSIVRREREIGCKAKWFGMCVVQKKLLTYRWA